MENVICVMLLFVVGAFYFGQNLKSLKTKKDQDIKTLDLIEKRAGVLAASNKVHFQYLHHLYGKIQGYRNSLDGSAGGSSDYNFSRLNNCIDELYSKGVTSFEF